MKIKELIFISSTVKNPLTDYGIRIKVKLCEIGQNQMWLIGQVKNKTGMFFDDSLLNKIMTGRSKSTKLILAINEILGFSDD